MASGRRDYTFGFLDEAALWGRTTTDYSYFNGDVIYSGEEKAIINYQVPTDIQLNINRIVIATEYLYHCIVTVLKNEDFISRRYFYEDVVMDFSERNPLRYNPGDVLKVLVSNIDEASTYVECTILGIITSTES